MIGLDNLTGPFRALDAVDMARLFDALERAGSVESVATIARAFHLSPRTVYRYKAEFRDAHLETVRVGGHDVTFVVYADRPPRQVSARRPR